MKSHDFELVGGDTDGLAFKKKDQSPFTNDERKGLLAELNSLMEGLINWEDDGVFPAQLVIKTKNYVLVDEKGKQKTKGSALKATTKEKALQAFVQEVIQLLLNDRQAEIYSMYLECARQILKLKSMDVWCSKHTVTKAVLSGKGTAQVRIRAALKDKPIQEGDKVYLFFKSETERCLLENFDGVYDKDILLGKLYDTLSIFETVIDITLYPKLTLKKNKALRTSLEVPNADV